VWLEPVYVYTPEAHHITQESLTGCERKREACEDVCRGRFKVWTVVGIAAGSLAAGWIGAEILN
jgi:hypothetical protein